MIIFKSEAFDWKHGTLSNQTLFPILSPVSNLRKALGRTVQVWITFPTALNSTRMPYNWLRRFIANFNPASASMAYNIHLDG